MRQKNKTITVGIDEVGRGCWAGPLVAAAVVLDKPIAGLQDSKQLTKAKRQLLSRLVIQQAAAFGIGWVEASEVDELGLTAAVSLAMERALLQIDMPFDKIIIDGNYNYLPEYLQATTMVKADATVAAVSAASIIAKVARDEYVATILHTKYPQYGFDRHVGYGTQLHQRMLREHGACSVHRQSFRPIQNLKLRTSGA